MIGNFHSFNFNYTNPDKEKKKHIYSHKNNKKRKVSDFYNIFRKPIILIGLFY